jgi:4-alpha-glucanotransferase
MTIRRSRRDLARLAQLYGIERSYYDVNQTRRDATDETILQLLRARRVDIRDIGDATDALAARTAALDCDRIEPVTVAWGHRLGAIPVRMADRTASRLVRYTIRMEDGSVRTAEVVPERIARPRAAPGSPTHRLRTRGSIPVGYHDIEIETMAGTLTSRLISAPRHAHVHHDATEWGVFMPLYALRGRDDAGTGTYTDLEELARWTAARGGSFVGTLPLLASFLDVCFEPSPYAPVSRHMWNELFVDVTRAPGWTPDMGGTASGNTGSPDTAHGDAESVVDYRAVGAHKLNALRAAAAAYYASGDTSGVERFVAANERVAEYARFRAVLDRRRESWHHWPDRLRDGEIRDGDFAPEDERFHCYAQWVAEQQISEIANASERDAAGLYLDLPLGVNADGFDAWRNRDLFAQSASTGAPPDALFTGGQDWGFRPPDPDVQRATGHRYFIESLRHHMRHARMVRMDHVMSLYRLYWIPAGERATHGAYVRYPVNELFAVVALESTRHQAAVVGEDLGTVPREIRTQMLKHRVMRMYVLQYEVSPDNEDPVTKVPGDVVASINTHDMPTFRGFVLGTELNDQLDLGLVDRDQYHASVAARNALIQRLANRFGDAENTAVLVERILEYLAGSSARAVLVNLEDLWLEERPQNVPGTSAERPNWTRRARLTLDQIMNDPRVLAQLEIIDNKRSSAVHAAVAEG